MRHLIIITSILAAAALISLAAVRMKKSRDMQVATLKSELDQKNVALVEAAEAKQRAEAQQKELLRLTDEMGAELKARQNQTSSAAAPMNHMATVVANGTSQGAASQPQPASAESGGFGKALAKMMQDPDTRAFIRQQQKAAMEQIYAPLIKQMGLSPEEAASFKEFLADNVVKATEQASALMSDTSAAARKEALEQMKAEQSAGNEKLKETLGEARFAQYKEYEETAGERALLNQHKQQFPSEYQLNEQQTEQVLAIVREEKKNVAATTGQNLSGTDQGENFQAMMSEEGVGKLIEAQTTLNSRVYDRASQILPPEQLNYLSGVQTNQLQMLRMSMTMARQMFGNGTNQPGQ